MRSESFQPSERLRPFVLAIRVVETGRDGDTDDPTISAPLPEAGLIFAIRYAGYAELIEGGSARRVPDASLTGVRTAIRRICTSPKGGVVVAPFRAIGALYFFDVPLHELFGGMAALLDLVAAREVDRLQTCLAEASTNAERAAIVDRYLCSRLKARRPDAVVAAAVSAIGRAGGAVRIAPLARELGLSTDRLEKRFRCVVGASPKQLTSVLRFRQVVSRYQTGVTLTQLAHDAGYCDQSHLIRDFRSFTGQPPGEFLRAGGYWM
jgi:AraC-like DNA-binding protein